MRESAPKVQASHLRQMVSLRQLQDITNANRKTLRRSLNAAGIRAIVIGTGKGKNVSIRYFQDDIENWLKERTEPAGIA